MGLGRLQLAGVLTSVFVYYGFTGYALKDRVMGVAKYSFTLPRTSHTLPCIRFDSWVWNQVCGVMESFGHMGQLAPM